MLAAAPLLVHCGGCAESRILHGLAAAVADDVFGQGLHPRCILSPGCAGTLQPLDAPAPLLARPAEARNGRHVAACPGCAAPVLHEYHYGFGGGAAPVPCPRCGTDLMARALQEWPRTAHGAQPMDLRVRLVGPLPRPAPASPVEVRAPPPPEEPHKLLDAPLHIF